MYQVIRTSDEQIIIETESLEKAQQCLFFYDTEDEPHYLVNKNEEMLYQ